MDDATVEAVRAVIRAIPPGQVMTYGQVAAEAGLRSARLVGRILAVDGADLPWHRVLRADGRCAPHLAAEQHARLRAEGVAVVDGRVDAVRAPAPASAPGPPASGDTTVRACRPGPSRR